MGPIDEGVKRERDRVLAWIEHERARYSARAVHITDPSALAGEHARVATLSALHAIITSGKPAPERS
jgi:hypothetical protein